jgi:hypothetical protein
MGIGDLIARGVKASQKASPAVSPQRLAELAEKVRKSGRLSTDVEGLLDDSLGIERPPLGYDPPSSSADKAFRILKGGEPGERSVKLTPRDVLSRWYENTPGGFDGAVENSQQALKKYGVVYPHSNSPAYGQWSPDAVDAPSRVAVNLELNKFDSPRGTYGAGGVKMNPAMLDATKARNATLEHEMTHHLMLHGQDAPDDPTLVQVQRAGNRRERFDSTPEGSITLQNNPSLALIYEKSPFADMRADAERALRPLVGSERYVMRRVELDPRVAEVRRRYAHHTGQDVTTPEEAEKAWDWYRTNRQHFEDLSSPHERPSMTHTQFNTYDALPPESKRIMFTRMTQVPAVLAPLGVGAASSQQGLLDGLRENR